jgi:hypothetical protein
VASSPTPPRYVPTLTEVVRLPERAPAGPIDPEWVVQEVMQRLVPQFEAMVRQTVHDVLSQHENQSDVAQRLQD